MDTLQVIAASVKAKKECTECFKKALKEAKVNYIKSSIHLDIIQAMCDGKTSGTIRFYELGDIEVYSIASNYLESIFNLQGKDHKFYRKDKWQVAGFRHLIDIDTRWTGSRIKGFKCYTDLNYSWNVDNLQKHQQTKNAVKVIERFFMRCLYSPGVGILYKRSKESFTAHCD